METKNNITWRIEEKVLPLKYSWKISRNSSESKTNLFIYVGDEKCFGIGEAAPNIRYREIPAELVSLFHSIEDLLPKNSETPVTELANWLENNKIPNALRFAIESAYVHFICTKRNISVQDFFGLPTSDRVATSFSLPIMPVEKLGNFITENNLQRFPYIKVKINKEEGFEILSEVAKYISKPLIIDPNESFTDVEELLKFSQKINDFNILMLEQPMPAHLTEEYKYLKSKSLFPVFADESMTDMADISALKEQFHGVNMKLMKAGGYIRGITQLKMAQQMGLKTMVGCMVETSLGIGSAMNLGALAQFADLDGFLILQHDPFDLLAEKQGFLQKV
ncbi:MAG: dipeptide epimerase [Sphingobacteriales bacterium]|nr:MAG: dipeptide epimerase [Sphingobacteriales bacterium]